MFHACTKHIEIDYHLLREQVAQKLMGIRFIHSEDQVVDGFTKALPEQRLITFRSNLNFTESCD